MVLVMWLITCFVVIPMLALIGLAARSSARKDPSKWPRSEYPKEFAKRCVQYLHSQRVESIVTNDAVFDVLVRTSGYKQKIRELMLMCRNEAHIGAEMMFKDAVDQRVQLYRERNAILITNAQITPKLLGFGAKYGIAVMHVTELPALAAAIRAAQAGQTGPLPGRQGQIAQILAEHGYTPKDW